MSKVAITGNPSGTGTLTIAAPDTNTDRTLTLPDATGTVFVSGQALSATTGTFSGAVSATSGTFSGAVQASGVATNIYPLVSATAVASTSGTSIDFTSIPSWVKRITVMFDDVSLNGTSIPQIQVGSGSVSTSGYVSNGGYVYSSGGALSFTSTTGLVLNGIGSAPMLMRGSVTLSLLNSNTWVSQGCFSTGFAVCPCGGKTPDLGGILDRVRITTVNGTDTFDAGTINIMYEG